MRNFELRKGLGIYLSNPNPNPDFEDVVNTNLNSVVFASSNLTNVEFKGANLKNARFSYNSIFNNISFEGANLEGTAFYSRDSLSYRRDSLIFEQLSKVKTFYRATGLDPHLEELLREEHSHLFEEPKY